MANNGKGKINPLVIGAAGLAVGAGVAAAATLRNNKKVQKKVRKLFEDVKTQAVDYANNLKEKPEVQRDVRKVKKAISKKKVVAKVTKAVNKSKRK